MKSKKQAGAKVQKNAPPTPPVNVVDETPEELSVVFESRNSSAKVDFPMSKKSMAKKAGKKKNNLKFEDQKT